VNRHICLRPRTAIRVRPDEKLAVDEQQALPAARSEPAPLLHRLQTSRNVLNVGIHAHLDGETTTVGDRFSAAASRLEASTTQRRQDRSHGCACQASAETVDASRHPAGPAIHAGSKAPL
jgi:hypothetical protein